MSLQQIGSSQTPQGLGAPGSRIDALVSRGAPEKKGTSFHGDPVDRESIAPQTAAFTRAMNLHDRQYAAAKEIRTRDQAMKAVGDTIDQMSEQLEAIVKNYPPFPPGSEERVQRLRSYAALRQIIDRLTVPPEKEARTLMAGRKKKEPTAESDQWALHIDPRGTTKTVWKEDLPTGPTGLNIPDLDPPRELTIMQSLMRSTRWVPQSTWWMRNAINSGQTLLPHSHRPANGRSDGAGWRRTGNKHSCPGGSCREAGEHRFWRCCAD